MSLPRPPSTTPTLSPRPQTISTPSPPPPAVHYQIPDIRSVRRSMIEDGSYVGYENFNRSEFMWTRNDFDHRLVKKSPDISADESKSFELSMIVRIPSLDFFLTSCAMWSGPNIHVRALHKAKPSCLGHAPADETLTADYKRAMINIRYLVDGIRRTGVTQRGLFTDEKIKFRHILFERMSVAPGEPALTPEFCLENWPADSMEVQPYLEKLKAANSYRPVPLPAYDLGGDLIRPALYRDRLQGATVVIKFTLCHYSIKKVDESDGYAADITYIRVLAPPRALASTPLKQNTHLRDPITPSTIMRTTRSSHVSAVSPYPKHSRARSVEYDSSGDYKPSKGIFFGEDRKEGSSKGVTARMPGLGKLMARMNRIG